RLGLDLAPPALIDDANAALVLQHDAAQRRLGDDLQIGPFHRRIEVAAGDAHAPAAGDACLRLADAFLVLAVVVRIDAEARLLGRLEESLVKRVLVRHGADAQRAAAATVLRALVFEALHALEEGGDVLPAPAARAHLGPGVVIERLAAHPDEAVDGAGAAEQLAARNGNGAVGGAGLGLGFVDPVGGRVVDQQTEADWEAGPEMVGATGFQEQHARCRILGEPGRYD